MKKPADIKDVWFILPDGTNIFDSEFRAGALSVARELALPKVRLSNETLLLKKFSIEKSGKNSAMAVIAHIRKPALLKAFGKSGIPLVLLGEEAVEDWRKAFGGPITVCSVDNESIGQMAADYLHEQGRFASYIYADGSSDQFYQWWTSRRYESFVDTLREHGYTGEVLRVPVLNSSAHADAEHFLKAMEKIPRPIAVFACNDRAAREIVSFCHLANLHIPDDVAVLGVDDEKDLCESCPVPLSSIKIEHYRLGRTAMHLILRMLEGGPRRDKVILCPPVRVIERASTKRSTPSDKFVASAVHPHRAPGHARRHGSRKGVRRLAQLSREALQSRDGADDSRCHSPPHHGRREASASRHRQVGCGHSPGDGIPVRLGALLDVPPSDRPVDVRISRRPPTALRQIHKSRLSPPVGVTR